MQASQGYLELAVQKTANPPAVWLWQHVSDIIDRELQVRVGGSFVWPPPGRDITGIRRVVFVAGGVGINPLISMLSHLSQMSCLPYEIRFVYSVRDPAPDRKASKILFLNRLQSIFENSGITGKLFLHLTRAHGGNTGTASDSIDFLSGKHYCNVITRRFTATDLVEQLGPMERRKDTLCYICGTPAMTDELIKVAQEAEGMDAHHVLFERWW